MNHIELNASLIVTFYLKACNFKRILTKNCYICILYRMLAEQRMSVINQLDLS